MSPEDALRYLVTTLLMGLLWGLLGVVVATRYLHPTHTPKPAINAKEWNCVIQRQPSKQCVLMRRVDFDNWYRIATR